MDPVDIPDITEEVAYAGLGFSRAELMEAMRTTYETLIAFVNSDGFLRLYEELKSLDPRDRPAFVAAIVLSPGELRKRNVQVPDGVLLQTSAFGDRRPTLFAVKKFLPERFHGVWENMNLTIDNRYADEDISRDADVAWRMPLPVALQNKYLAAGLDLESIPAEISIEPARLFEPVKKR